MNEQVPAPRLTDPTERAREFAGALVLTVEDQQKRIIVAEAESARLRGEIQKMTEFVMDQVFKAHGDGQEEGWRDAIEACRKAQPCTAEKPDENTYQKGFFDGVIEYGRAILEVERSTITAA